MMRRNSMILAMMLAAMTGSGAARAETCWDKAAEGSGASRDAAMRQAYLTVLAATDPQLANAWVAANQRVGDAPGYAVRKLSLNCVQGGLGQNCKIEVTICKP